MRRSLLALLGLTYITIQLGSAARLAQPETTLQKLSATACLYGGALLFGMVILLGAGAGWWLATAYLTLVVLAAALPLLAPVPFGFNLVVGPLALTAGPLAYGFIAAGNVPARV
jgi:hypothetical protein